MVEEMRLSQNHDLLRLGVNDRLCSAFIVRAVNEPRVSAALGVRAYANNASSEEWTTFVGALGRSDDRGHTCLKRCFTFALVEVAKSDADTALDG
jgi:hypothetical protein